MKNKHSRQKRQQFEVIRGEGKRFSFINFKRAFVFYVLLLIAFIIIIQLGYHWLGNQFLSWRLQIISAEMGVMESRQDAAGLITREEEIIVSPSPGVVLELAPAGGRVSADSELASIGVISRAQWLALQEPENEEDEEAMEERVPIDPMSLNFQEVITLTTEHPGFLSHYIDGWEHYSEPFYITADQYEIIKPEGRYTVRGDLVDSGQAVMKVVNNWRWYYSIIIPLHPGRIIAEQRNVELEFDFAPEEMVRAVLIEYAIDQENQIVRLAYEIQQQVVGFEQTRWAEASLLYSRQQGIIIPAEAVFEYDNSYGVFINQGGKVVFQPLTIVERRDDQIMVEGLPAQSMIITRPEHVVEGQRLY
ncbi:MAG: HlyD family efflux transporter periplasmic adaptor subunit [Bacillota bacterium]|nr:HlyD family efflux transporter periplasmic adaptor subunit [Bacillota bacterium]